MGEGVLYNIVFTELSFKTVSGDVASFHRITGIKHSRVLVVCLHFMALIITKGIYIDDGELELLSCDESYIF